MKETIVGIIVTIALAVMFNLLWLAMSSCSPSSAQVVEPKPSVVAPTEPPPTFKLATPAGDWQTLMVVNLVRVSCIRDGNVDEQCCHEAIACMVKLGARELTAEEIIECTRTQP